MYSLLKVLIGCCGFLLVQQSAYTQAVDLGVLEQRDFYTITPQVSLLKTAAPISLDSARTARSASRFQKLPNKTVIFYGYEPDFYWFRFVIRNEKQNPKELMLLMGPIGMKTAELFQKRNGRWTSMGKTGYRYRFSERPYQYAHYVFPLSVQPASLDTFYIFMDFSHDYRTYGFVLFHPKALKAEENKVYFSFGIIIGLLILFWMFNLYLYFSSRERIHLWYSMYILILILVVIKHDQLDEQFLGWDSAAMYRLTPIMSFAALAIGVLTHVVQVFLINSTGRNQLYRLTLFFKYNAILSALAHFILFKVTATTALEAFVFNWADMSAILAILMIVINCIYSVFKGYKAAWFIITGIGLFLVGAMERLLLISSPTFLFPPSIFHLGIIMETVIISCGLVYRSNLDKKEKLRYLKEKEQLEVVFEKQLLEIRLEIQEQTLKTISQEIHDNIGQHLILVKMNLNRLPDQGNAGGIVAESRQLVAKAIQDLRHLSKSLNTEFVLEQGLVKSIELELESIRQAVPVQTSFQVTEDPIFIDHQKELVLFRICQEALNNIIKHANATRIDIDLALVRDVLIVKIRDNGMGFSCPEGSGAASGIGLRNMRNRARAIGAALEIQSAKGCGTCIQLSLPVTRPPRFVRQPCGNEMPEGKK